MGQGGVQASAIHSDPYGQCWFVRGRFGMSYGPKSLPGNGLLTARMDTKSDLNLNQSESDWL
eukprot:12408217-Karenia_brevis.AAC.1